MLVSAKDDIVTWSATICDFIDSWIPEDVDNPLTFWKTNQMCSFERYDMLSPHAPHLACSGGIVVI